MSFPMTLLLPMPANRANARGHWRVQHKAKKAYWDTLTVLMHTGLIPKPPRKPPRKVRVETHFRTYNKSDTDNLVARMKPVLDFLVAWGYLMDDGPDHMVLAMPTQEISRKNCGLQVTITEVS